MTKQDKKLFYSAFGNLVKARRTAMGYTYAQFGKLVGEQNKTIRDVEAGKQVTMHHLVWANMYLSINLHDIIDYIKNREVSSGNIEELI